MTEVRSQKSEENKQGSIYFGLQPSDFRPFSDNLNANHKLERDRRGKEGGP